MTAIPILETERLRLRPHRLEDFEESAAMWGDPAVTNMLGAKPYSKEEIWGRLLRHAGNWVMLGFGSWVVEEKTGGAFAGEMGFLDARREIEPRLTGLPEIGWAIAPRAQGKGYATEATRAALAWGDAHFGLRRTVCLINAANRPSIRVAEKCGYREWTRTTYRDNPSILFDRVPG
jgi:RimJ/RimL family protein N-acetyltransferase